MRREDARRGHTLIELVVAAAILSSIAIISTSLIAGGLDANRRAMAEQNANRTAGAVLESVVRELKDAAAATVEFDPANPDRLTFRRMRGYDPAIPDIASRRLLSGRITYRRTAFAVPGASGLYAAERVEEGGTTSRLGGFLADRDPQATDLPGFRFDVMNTLGAKFVHVVVVASVPSGRAGDPAVARREATVSIEVQ